MSRQNAELAVGYFSILIKMLFNTDKNVFFSNIEGKPFTSETVYHLGFNTK